MIFQVNIGSKHKAEPGWLLPLICRRGHVTRTEVGSIKIERDHTNFEIAGDAASEFAANAAERDPRAPNVYIKPAGGAPSSPTKRPAHAGTKHAK